MNQVDKLINQASAILADAFDEAAAIAVVAVDKHGAALTTFCKKVASDAAMPDAWNALRMRAQRMQEKARSERVDGAISFTPTTSQKGAVRGARSVLKAQPALVDELLKDPEVLSLVSDAVYNQGRTRKPSASPERREMDAYALMLKWGAAGEEMVRRLPDYEPADKDMRDEARMVAEHGIAAAEFLQAWARGKSIADDVEAFLAAREWRMKNAKIRAAAIIRDSLKQKNRQDCDQLRKRLTKYGLGQHSLSRGVRLIRDVYGDHALTTAHDGRRIVYVLDPSAFEARAYANEHGRRALTETEHLLGLLDWLAQQYGNVGYVRKARRYGRNMVEELREFVVATANGNGDGSLF